MFVFICILLTVGSSDIRLSHLHSPYVSPFRIRFHDLTHSRRQYENFHSQGWMHLSEIGSIRCQKGKRPVTAYILVFSVSFMHEHVPTLSLSLSLSVSLLWRHRSQDATKRSRRLMLLGPPICHPPLCVNLTTRQEPTKDNKQRTPHNNRKGGEEGKRRFPLPFRCCRFALEPFVPACTAKHQSLAVQNTTTERSRTGSRNTTTNNDKHKHTDSSSPSS